MLGHRSPSSMSRVGGWLLAGAALCALVPIQLTARPGTVSPKVLPPHLKAWPWAAKAEEPASTAAAQVAATTQAKEPAHKANDERLEFVLVNRDRHGVTMSGSWQDAERLKRQYRDERVLWFRHDGKAYVVKDAGALDEAERINRPVAKSARSKVRSARSKVRLAPGKERLAPSRARLARSRARSAPSRADWREAGRVGGTILGKLTDAEQREVDAEHERLEKEMAR